MSLKNLYAWNGGKQKKVGTGCGIKRSTGCEMIAKSTGCGLATKSTGCGIVVAPSKR